jgi:hypothetical protein
MAKVKIEEIIDDLSSQMRRALGYAVKEVLPNSNADEYELFRAFRRAVGRTCSTWERVPDRYIEKE